jgi:hypothetical protein
MIFYNYNQVRTFIILLIGFYLMLLPALLHAQVVINEIVYDPEGTDTGREWIEVYNTGDNDVDLATYKLFESNVNHKITVFSENGESILKSHNFATVADNPEKFLIDFPNFTGPLFDSAFSLNNSGEPLSIVDNSGNVSDHFEYSSDLGAGNNGNSLQRNEAGFWIEAGPTVGLINKQEAELVNDSGDSSATSTTNSSNSSTATYSTHSSQTDLSQYSEKSTLEIGSGRNRFSGVHAPIEFKAEYNTDRRPKFMWSWGDGSSDSGYKTSHIYENSGTYNVVLNALLNGYQATSRVKAEITDISVDILYITYGKLVDIVLKNTADKEVNLGGFVIKMASNKFEIPADTIIDAKSQITIPAKYTDFETSTSTEFIKLYYPDSNLYKESMFFEIPSQESVSF